MRDGEKTMMMRVLNFCRIAALLCVGLGFGLSATPAAAQCGYGGCYAAPVIAPPVVSCGCCGCGSYYNSYYAAYAYPSYGSGCCGGGYGYGGYGYGGYGYGGGGYVGLNVGVGPVVAPRVWGPRPYYRRYVGPRRLYARY
jgi:hypothetical protein